MVKHVNWMVLVVVVLSGCAADVASEDTTLCDTKTIESIFGSQIMTESRSRTDTIETCFIEFENATVIQITISQFNTPEAAQANLENSIGLLGEGQPLTQPPLDEGIWVPSATSFFGRAGGTVIGISGSGDFPQQDISQRMLSLAVNLAS